MKSPETPEPGVVAPGLPKATRWSDPHFILGIVSGGALMGVGAYLQMHDSLQPTVSTLIICSGLGIIFGAFGSTATINWKGMVVTGVAAITVALLGFLNYLMRDQVVHLTISGDVAQARNIELIIPNRRTYAGAHYDKYFEFVISGRDVVTDMQLAIVFPDGHPNGVEVPFDCVPRKALSDFVGSERPVNWRFSAAERALLRVKGVKNDKLASGSCPEAAGEEPDVQGEQSDDGAPSPFADLGMSFIRAAFAQTQKSIPTLLGDLDSDSATVRYTARKELSAAGTQAVEPMLAYWERNPTYRTRLGVSVALTEYLRGHKEQRREISAQITDAQLDLLVKAAVDPDRTLRIYASEFLYSLGDKRIVESSRATFGKANDQGRYNLTLLMSSVTSELNTGEKEALGRMLTEWKPKVGEKTSGLIDGAIAKLPAAARP